MQDGGQSARKVEGNRRPAKISISRPERKGQAHAGHVPAGAEIRVIGRIDGAERDLSEGTADEDGSCVHRVVAGVEPGGSAEAQAAGVSPGRGMR